MSVKELKMKAKELGLKGYSNLNKAELEVLVQKEEDKRIADMLTKEAALAASNSVVVEAPKSNKGGKEMKKKVSHAKADEQLKALLAAHESGKEELASISADGKEVLEQIKVEVQQIPKVVYKYVPTKMAEVDGFRINPVTIDGVYSCTITKEKFKIATGNQWYQAVMAGRIKVAILEFNGNTEIKKKVVRAAVHKFYENGKTKRGAAEFLLGKTADQSKSVFYYGNINEIKRIIGCHPSIKRPVNKLAMPTFSNNILEFVSSDIEVAKIMVVDTGKKNQGLNTNDGGMYWDNVKFYYETYVSEKDLAEGKKSKRLPLDEAQVRMNGFEINSKGELVPVPVIKGDSYMPTFHGNAAEFCKANGLELGDCHGAVDIESLKANPRGYKHGDIMEVNMRTFMWANKVSEEAGGGMLGTQGQCCDPNFVEAILTEERVGMGRDKMGELVEPGIAAKGKIFKDLLAFKAKAVARCLRATSSMEDTPLQEIKALAFAIPRNAKGEFCADDDPTVEWYSPAYETQFNQLCARAWAYYTNDVVRVKTSRCGGHFMAHPSLLLDRLEQKIYDETGTIVNLMIPPNSKEFMEDYNAHQYVSVGRSPLVGPASIGEVLCVYVDENGEYITDLAKLRAREGKLVTCTKSGLMVSSRGIKTKDGWLASFIKMLNGDFDGDGYLLIFSNVAAAPVYRTPIEMPGIEEDKPAPSEMSDEDFRDALCEAYDTQIESQKAIGQMDNFRKLLYATRRVWTGKMVKINGVERKCIPIPASIGHELAEKCEEMIQAKKHVIDNKSVTLLKTQLTKKYAPNGELPTGDARPLQFLLLHNSMGLTESEDQHINHEILLTTLCNIVNHYNKVGIHELDCYAALWKAMNGIKLEIRHNDSEYWRAKFVELWGRVHNLFSKPNAPIDEETGKPKTTRISEKTIGMVTSMGDFINGNGEERKDGEWSGFRYYTNQYLAIKDNEERTKKFSELYKDVEQKIKNWLRNTCGDETKEIDQEVITNIKNRKDVQLKLLVMYLGSIGFGVGIDKQGNDYSLPGRAIWVMGSTWKEGKNALRWVAKQIHPNNPYLKGVK